MIRLLDRFLILTLLAAVLAFYTPARTDGVNVAPCTASTAWVPTDGSGAALVFTSVSAAYTVCGNMVHAYATVTYPITADGSAARITGFPVSFPVPTYGRQCSISVSTEATLTYLFPTANSTLANLLTNANVAITNVTMSTDVVYFICSYPAS